jgi:hypothetical protein
MNNLLRKCVWVCAGMLGASLVAPASSLAEADRAGPVLLVFSDAVAVESAVSVRVQADYLTLQLNVTSDADTVGERLELLEDVDRALRVVADKAGIELLTRTTPQVEAGYGKLGSSVSSSVASIFGAGGDAGAHYVLAARLDEPKESLFRVAARLHAAASGLKLPKKVSARIGQQRLALVDVEARRDAVRAEIGRHLKQDRALVLGGAETAVAVNGLDGPLRVSPVGERELALWLPFKATWGNGADEAGGRK